MLGTETGFQSWGHQAPGGSVFTQQPAEYVAPGSITVRQLRDTQEDADFAAKLVVEAFRGKVVYAAGEHNLSSVRKNMAVNHRGQDPGFYSRTFIAEYEGRSAGLLQLKFKGDKTRERDDYLNEIGCCSLFGLWRLNIITNENVPRGKCYLDHIAVDEGFRGKGIGKVLMEKAEQEARLKGCSAIYLGVVTTNRAKNLYERQGYIVTSEENCCGCLRCCLGENAVFMMEKRL